jgi:hypothetical protein
MTDVGRPESLIANRLLWEHTLVIVEAVVPVVRHDGS